MEEAKYINGRSERASSFTDVNDCSNLWNEDEVIKMDIFTACSIGEYNCVRQHLADGVELADLDRPNIGGWTPLMYAAYVGHDNIVNLLLDNEVDVNARTSKNGATPLMLAASCGNESVVYFLLQNGAKIDIQDNRGWTCLFYATFQGHQKVVKLLLENGADKELRELSLGLTPLLAAGREGHEVIFEELVRCGANISARTKHGVDVRSLALQQGNMAVVNIIDQQGFHNVPNYLLRSEPGLLPDESDLVEEKVHDWLQGKNIIPNAGIRDGPEAFEKLMRSHHKDGKPMNIPVMMTKQERVGHVVGSPYLLNNTPGSEGAVGSFEEHFFINCGRTVERASLHKQLQKVNSYDSETNKSSPIQTNGILPVKPTIASFLQELKLTKYISTFDEQDVDFDTLLSVTESDLKEIGISLFGPRKKILTAVSRWKEENYHSKTTSSSKAQENVLQCEVRQKEAQLHRVTSEVQQLQMQLAQEKELRLVVEGCLIEEKAKRQEIYTRVCRLQEQWKQTEGEVEMLRTLCQEMKGNCNMSQEQAKEVCSKLESTVANLSNFVQLGTIGTSSILGGQQNISQSGNSSESSGNSSS